MNARKRFLFCEALEGGMDTEVMSLGRASIFLKNRIESMRKAHLGTEEDEVLFDWLQRADVGEWFDHAAGAWVRLKDE